MYFIQYLFFIFHIKMIFLFFNLYEECFNILIYPKKKLLLIAAYIFILNNQQTILSPSLSFSLSSSVAILMSIDKNPGV